MPDTHLSLVPISNKHWHIFNITHYLRFLAEGGSFLFWQQIWKVVLSSTGFNLLTSWQNQWVWIKRAKIHIFVTASNYEHEMAVPNQLQSPLLFLYSIHTCTDEGYILNMYITFSARQSNLSAFAQFVNFIIFAWPVSGFFVIGHCTALWS